MNNACTVRCILAHKSTRHKLTTQAAINSENYVRTAREPLANSVRTSQKLIGAVWRRGRLVQYLSSSCPRECTQLTLRDSNERTVEEERVGVEQPGLLCMYVLWVGGGMSECQHKTTYTLCNTCKTKQANANTPSSLAH